MLEASAFDFEDQWRALQVAVLAIEMVASGSVADEPAVDGGRRGENFARRQIRPVTRTDQAAGLHPVEPAVEVGGEFCARLGFYRESFRAQHAFPELVAQPVNHAVVGAHALPHDFRRYANHMRVTNLTA